MKTLIKETPWLSLNQIAPGDYETDNSFTHGWITLGPQIFAYKTYIDLAGMSQQQKTMFFQGAGQQDLYTPLVQGQTQGDSIITADVMTAHSLTDTELLRLVSYGNFGDSDNIGIAGITFAETIYMRYRQFAVDLDTQALGHMITISDNQLGSLEPTASDRVYCYKLVLTLNQPAATVIQIPPTRYILRAEAREEEMYRYLMRLKRSYELQQEPDVD